MQHTITVEGFQFFHELASWSYRPSIETPEQGRVRSALELARAEYALAMHPNAWVEWSPDHDPDTSWMDSEALEEYRSGGAVLMEAVLYVDGEDKAALGGIHLREPWRTNDYRREVEARLALEAGICHPLDRRIVA